MPWLPVLHTPQEDRAFFADQIGSPGGWGAAREGALVGFAIAGGGWLRHLYVDPAWCGQGVGSALLVRALAGSRGGRQLGACEQSAPALAGYAGRGFTVVERTDGAGNEERLPDVRMVHGAMVTTAD
jgi:GNAT superfamily N-acetyltransferase